MAKKNSEHNQTTGTAFVPLNQAVYTPDWSTLVSQDIPFEDGEDGWIEVIWTNKTPLFVRDKESVFSAHITTENGKKLYFIPGSSIKGMLRNTLSILSFGKLQSKSEYKYTDRTGEHTIDISQWVNHLQDDGVHDLCETIFGWSDAKDSMKGRVQIGNAFVVEKFGQEWSPVSIEDSDLEEQVSGLLMSPTPTPKTSYFVKDEDKNIIGVAGRKLYRISPATESLLQKKPKGNQEDTKESRMRPLKAGYKFKMRINVHNLKPIEVGALLYAITFNDWYGICHNIGAAKRYGYGAIQAQLRDVTLSSSFKVLDPKHYTALFEEEMNKFMPNWKFTEQLSKLRTAWSEEGKDPFASKTATKTVDPAKERIEITIAVKALQEQANEAYKKKDWTQAKLAYKQLIRNKKKLDDDTTSEEHILQEIMRASNQAATPQAKPAEQSAPTSLGAFLTDSGVKDWISGNNGNNGLSKLKAYQKNVSKRGKDSVELDETEKEELSSFIVLLKDNPVKKEIADWKNFNSKLWQSIKAYLGEEHAKELFNTQG